jgi:hypothetical protein
MQKLNLCHEEFYGGYCVANVWKLWHHYGGMTTINNVEKHYCSAYTEAVRVLTYFKDNILESKKVLEPPPCMLNGSFVKAVNLIEFNKLNQDISSKVRSVGGDKDEDDGSKKK